MSVTSELYDFIQAKRKSGYTYLGYSVYDVTRKDVEKISKVARFFGFPAEWLANLINFESAGTFNPAITNSLGYVGLIQFGTSAARSLGTTQDQLRKMDFSTQMYYVAGYINKVLDSKNMLTGGKVSKDFSQTDLFMTIFYPVAVGKSNYTFPPSVVAANNGIATPQDYTDRALKYAPFKKTVFSSASEKAGEIVSSFADFKAPWWAWGVGIFIFGTITVVYLYHREKSKS